MSGTNLSLRDNVKRGVRTGMAVAIGFSIVVLVVYALAGSSDLQANHRMLIGVIATYCVGGLCIGAIGGALTPFMRSTVGFAFGAVFLGMLAYIAFQVEETGPIFWRHFDWTASTVFAVIGIATGFGARARIRSRARARGQRDT
jgi:drug/metabolite transporter (DMT)-like permease